MSIRACLAALLLLIGLAGPAPADAAPGPAANNNQADDAAAIGVLACVGFALLAGLGLVGLIVYLCSREPAEEPAQYARDYDGDEDDDDTPRPSRRLREREDDYDDEDRGREWGY